jgi:hypothetical protein
MWYKNVNRAVVFFMLFSCNLFSQTFTYSGYIRNADGTGAVNVPVKLYKRTTTTTSNQNTSVKIFKTHYGNGNTSQYAPYPMTRVEMDKCFNTSYAATTLFWSGTISGAASLNFNQYTTLTSAGASVPPNGDYYSTEVTFSFTPKETGTYTFGLTSDDGGDLYLLGYGNVIEWYGGKGTGQYLYGSVNLTLGTTYTFIARMQEYAGGDGLLVYWKRPSQSGYSYRSDEIGGTTTTTTAWTLDATSNTNSSGYYSFSRPTTTGTEWYIQLDAPTPVTSHTITDIRGVTDNILGNTIRKSIHWLQYDTNNDGKISISDAIYINRKQNGLTTFPYPSRIFTPTQYTSLTTSTTDLRSTTPGVSSITITSPVSGTTTGNYYLIAPGYKGQVTY